MLNLCEQLEQNPKNLDILKAIITTAISSSAQFNQCLEATPKLIQLFTKYFTKISSTKQQKTFQLISSYAVSYAKVLLAHAQIQSQETQQYSDIFQALTQLIVICPKNTKNMIIKAVYQSAITVNKISENYEVKWSNLRNCELLACILQNIDKQQIQKYFKVIANFLISIDHASKLDTTPIQKSSEQSLIKFKKTFQTVFLELLEVLQARQLNDKLHIYRRLGEKVFSKMNSSLILADYLLQKFHSESQNPSVQIEVLSSLFILVGKEGLELQKFYDTLESMLQKERSMKSSLFRQKNSKRFLKLLQSSMRSSRVPFQKIMRLCRIIIQKIMSEESQFNFWALSFFVNLVKKHRQLQKHLHQFPQLEILKEHYSPKIRSLVQQLHKNLDKSEYLEIEDFQKIKYAKLIPKKVETLCKKLTANQQEIQFKFIQTDAML